MKRWVIAFLAASATACGIPVDSEPETVDIDLGNVSNREDPIPGDLTAVSIYLVRQGSLIQVSRDLPTPATEEVILESLLGPVTEPERRAGLRTAIPQGTQVNAITSDGATLRVDLSREFASVGGEEEVLAVAQIALTATSIDNVDLVGFQLEGVPTGVPVANGALSDDPVGANDYESLVAP